jgi:carbonic anhydrase/acetyltransferase-like protein (isoleucine patch superfamily)
MPLYSFEGRSPHVHPGAFIAPTASLVGDVTVEQDASVWYGAVIRADYAPVVVRRGANVQDGAVVHGPPGQPMEIGEGATVAHNCVVHGAVLGAECLVANGAIVLDGARVGARALIAAGAVVASGVEIPDGMLAAGVPAQVKRAIEGTPSEFWVKTNPEAYRELARRHRTGVTEVT